MRTLFAIALAAALQSGWAQDKTVVLYTSLAPTESGPLAQAFEKKTGIKVEVWRALSEKVVQRALSFGFSLRELAAMLRARDTGEIPCERVYRLAQEKLRRVKNDIRTLKATEKQLTTILIDWQRRIQY